MKIHVVARHKSAEARFRSSNSHINFVSHIGQRSYLALLTSIISDEAEDYALVVHDDTVFSRSLLRSVTDLIGAMNQDWPNWGVCSNAGIAAYSFGQTATPLVRYLFDPHAGPNGSEAIVPAQTIDGNVILLNCKALRSAGLKLPDFLGFHFYDVILSIECITAGRGVFVVPQLACFHRSGGNQSEFDKASKSDALLSYLNSRLVNSSLVTINGRIPIPFGEKSRGIDIELAALETAALGRRKASVTMLVRSQFRHPGLLHRTLVTAKATSVSASPYADFKLMVVTDKPDAKPDFVDALADTYLPLKEYEAADTRALLIRDAVKAINTDFIWIIDDDDWLFPNEAPRLALTLSVAPSETIVFVDSSQFPETFSPSGHFMGEGYSTREGTHFPASRWSRGLGGQNHIPMCGMIVSNQAVRKIPNEIFTNIVYFEDYAVQLFSLNAVQYPPIVVSKLMAGISVRDEDNQVHNTITEKDRTKWDRSLSELSFLISNSSLQLSNMLSMQASSPSGTTVQEVKANLSRGERAAVVGFRVARGLSLFVRRPRRAPHYLRQLSAAYRRNGFKEVIISIACTTR